MDVLLVGDHQHREFAAACRWLGERSTLVLASEVEQGLARVAELGGPPHLVVFAQSRPGQLSRSDVESLHAALPLARLVALLGSWCEGETRSGRPWPGVTRVYWHEWLPRMATMLADVPAHRSASWSLPRTATDAEALLAAAAPGCLQRSGVAAIAARRFATFTALADACELGGLASVWLTPEQRSAVQGATVALWDSSGWGPFEVGELARFSASLVPVPVIALLDFPRLEEREQVLAAGAAAVVSKPFLLDDLLWQFDQVLGEPERQTRVSEAA
jgi:hypothetical protein